MFTRIRSEDPHTLLEERRPQLTFEIMNTASVELSIPASFDEDIMSCNGDLMPHEYHWSSKNPRYHQNDNEIYTITYNPIPSSAASENYSAPIVPNNHHDQLAVSTMSPTKLSEHNMWYETPVQIHNLPTSNRSKRMQITSKPRCSVIMKTLKTAVDYGRRYGDLFWKILCVILLITIVVFLVNMHKTEVVNEYFN